MSETQTNQDNTQEYSLIDLVVLIIKHRKLFMYTIFSFTFLGIFLAGINHFKKQHIYRQPLQLASYYLDGKQYLLQGSQEVVNAVSNLYVPRFLTEYKAQHPKFNELNFLSNFSAQASFLSSQDKDGAPSSMVYLEYKGEVQDLEAFKSATASILQQIMRQEQPMINSLTVANQENLELLKNEVPRLEKVGHLLKSYSTKPNTDIHQEIAMTVSTRETYLDLISQSQVVQNVIEFKQTMNTLTQKIDSLTTTKVTPLIVINAKPSISFVTAILLSFIVGVFMGLLLVFIKAMSAAIKLQFKLRKN